MLPRLPFGGRRGDYVRMPPLILGRTNARARFRAFGINPPDRLAHLYIVGETGVGKSSLLEGILRQDISSGTGCALIDPHGDVATRILRKTPPHMRDCATTIFVSGQRQLMWPVERLRLRGGSGNRLYSGATPT